jgi:hypothetical protein
MPCRSYEDDHHSGSPTDSWQYRELKEINDRLARIACKAMTELVEQGKADFLVLRDDELREWWEKHQEADRKARKAEEAKKRAAEEKKRLAQLRSEVLAKLTSEEKKALGIKTKG